MHLRRFHQLVAEDRAELDGAPRRRLFCRDAERTNPNGCVAGACAVAKERATTYGHIESAGGVRGGAPQHRRLYWSPRCC